MPKKPAKPRTRIVEELKPGGSIVVHDEKGSRLLKRPRDVNQWAKHMLDLATGVGRDPDPDAGKNPAAVELGRKGGLKGGIARAEKMSKTERTASAKNAHAFHEAVQDLGALF